MKKIKIFVLIIAGILLLTIFIPLPKRIYKTYSSINIQNEMKADINLRITYLDFLFFNDKISGTISLSTGSDDYIYSTDSLRFQGEIPANNEDEYIYAFNGVYLNKLSIYDQVSAYISKDFNKIVISHKENGLSENSKFYQFAGNADSATKTEVIKYFDGYIK